MDAYERGYIEKLAEYGVDPEMVKQAQFASISHLAKNQSGFTSSAIPGEFSRFDPNGAIPEIDSRSGMFRQPSLQGQDPARLARMAHRLRAKYKEAPGVLARRRTFGLDDGSSYALDDRFLAAHMKAVQAATDARRRIHKYYGRSEQPWYKRMLPNWKIFREEGEAMSPDDQKRINGRYWDEMRRLTGREFGSAPQPQAPANAVQQHDDVTSGLVRDNAENISRSFAAISPAYHRLGMDSAGLMAKSWDERKQEQAAANYQNMLRSHEISGLSREFGRQVKQNTRVVGGLSRVSPGSVPAARAVGGGKANEIRSRLDQARGRHNLEDFQRYQRDPLGTRWSQEWTQQ